MNPSVKFAGLILCGALFAGTGLKGQNITQYFEIDPVDRNFVHLPVKTGSPKTWMTVNVDGELQHEFEIELAPENPDFYATLETGKWKGKKLLLTAESVTGGSKWLSLVKTSDEMSDEDKVYKEEYRPQFHFSPRRGWTNDPNGLVCYKGVYHLFFQHNPYGTGWGNMTWGHATSIDLFHWTEKPDAVLPDKNGVVFSGSAVVDWNNTSGLQTNPQYGKKGRISNPPLVAFYTSTNADRGKGFAAQSMVYSLDEGNTWIKYPGNPVIPHIIGGNRDPKVFWYEDKKNPSNPESGKWIMALYMDGQDFALFSSDNLISWKKICDIKNTGYECPDIYELSVDGNKNNTRWVFREAGGKYLIGKFDGENFTAESGPLNSKYGGNDYAAQTYSDIPEADGRRIMLSWMSGGKYPGMPFNQQFTVPRNLTLRSTPDGIRLFMEPAKEIERLRISKPVSFSSGLSGINNPVKVPGLSGDLFDISILMRLDPAASTDTSNMINTEIFDQIITYNYGSQTIELNGIKAHLAPVGNRIKLRLITDITSIELFANDGIVQIAQCFVNEEKSPADMTISGQKGLARFRIKAYSLKQVWNR